MALDVFIEAAAVRCLFTAALLPFGILAVIVPVLQEALDGGLLDSAGVTWVLTEEFLRALMS